MSEGYARARQERGPAAVAAFQVRGRFMTALALRIDTDRVDGPFLDQLDDQLRKSPQLVTSAPMVLDFVNVPGFGADSLRDLVDSLRRRDLRIFGVQNAPRVDAAVLQDLGLIPLSPGREAPVPSAAEPEAPAVDAPKTVRNVVVRSPVRSGQTVVAEDGDLTVIGSVASGAELVAAGNIHVYGPLRGRAMAGCHGDMTAHIFCQSLSAELVAIAGIYQTSETLEDTFRQRCTHIFLQDEKLRMEVIA